MLDQDIYQTIYQAEWESVQRRIHHYFARREPLDRVQLYLEGLMSDIRRRNSWQLAEVAGEARPDGMQRLLNGSRWEEDGVRDAMQSYALETLGATDAVLVVDETGFLKKGSHSAGVKRQYSGTAGRIENCQIGVFLTYTTCEGQALVDRELYLPNEWTSDDTRRQMAGIPEGVSFQTKPQLAQQMLQRAMATGLIVDWVTGDSIYGSARSLRVWLERCHQPFVLGIKSDEALWCGCQQVRATQLSESVTDDAWQRISAGEGAKGPRWYDWVALSLPRWGADPDWQHALLLRRSLSDPTKLAYYVVFAPATTTLTDWVAVAGRRWTVEETFEHAKDELGLDQYEVRSWTGWYRHITLVMLAQNILNALQQHIQTAEKKML